MGGFLPPLTPYSYTEFWKICCSSWNPTFMGRGWNLQKEIYWNSWKCNPSFLSWAFFFCPWQRWPYLPRTSSCFHKGPLVFVLQTLQLTRYIFARKCRGSKRYFPQIPVILSLSEFSLRVCSFFKCHLILRSVMGLLFLWGGKSCNTVVALL